MRHLILRCFSTRRPPVNTVVHFVPQQEAWVIERMGRYRDILKPGFALLMPIIDRIAYVHTLKEVALEIPGQSAITHDNVSVNLESVLYFKVIDAYKASYGVEDCEFAITQLAQTTMRSEIGKLSLDKTLEERSTLNVRIVDAINIAATDWGIQCLRHEIRDIHPPKNVVESMHSQVAAERSKRAQILESEGSMQSEVNKAQGRKQAAILASEADMMEKVNRAEGEAKAIITTAHATAESIKAVSKALNENKLSNDAVALTIAHKYVEAWANIAKESTTVVIPQSVDNVSSMVTQALAIYDKVKK